MRNLSPNERPSAGPSGPGLLHTAGRVGWGSAAPLPMSDGASDPFQGAPTLHLPQSWSLRGFSGFLRHSVVVTDQQVFGSSIKGLLLDPASHDDHLVKISKVLMLRPIKNESLQEIWVFAFCKFPR